MEPLIKRLPGCNTSNPVVFLPDILLFSCLPAVQYSPIPRFDVWLTSSPVFSCRSAIHLSNIGTSFCSIFRCPAVPITIYSVVGPHSNILQYSRLIFCWAAPILLATVLLSHFLLSPCLTSDLMFRIQNYLSPYSIF